VQRGRTVLGRGTEFEDSRQFPSKKAAFQIECIVAYPAPEVGRLNNEVVDHGAALPSLVGPPKQAASALDELARVG
jgi:hypothetical protein